MCPHFDCKRAQLVGRIGQRQQRDRAVRRQRVLERDRIGINANFIVHNVFLVNIAAHNTAANVIEFGALFLFDHHSHVCFVSFALIGQRKLWVGFPTVMIDTTATLVFFSS